MLGTEPGLDVAGVQTDDLESVERALAASPQVIVFERGDPDRAVEILELVPDALIIDIGIGPGPTFAYRRDEISALPDAILAAIHQAPSRRCARHAPVPIASRGLSPGPEIATSAIGRDARAGRWVV